MLASRQNTLLETGFNYQTKL